jgi:hypothetical protein
LNIFQIVGCVAICNLPIKSTISQIRTACTEVRETGFLRVAVRNRVFEFNQNWEANIVAKTRFLICARGVKETF